MWRCVWLLVGLCCAVEAQEFLGQTALERLQGALSRAEQGLPWQAEQLARELETVAPSLLLTRQWGQLLAAQSLVRQGLWRQGWEELRRVLEQEQLPPLLRLWGWQWAGIAAFALREYAQAQRSWDSTLQLLSELSPARLREKLRQEVEYWYLLALLHQAQYNRADTLAEGYARRYPTSPYADEALFFRALLAELRSQYREAAERFRAVWQAYPCGSATAAALAREAYVRLVLREFPQALLLTERLQLFLERFRRGDTLGCERLDTADLPWEELLFIRGQAYLETQQWPAAQQLFEQLVARYPEGRLSERARLQLAWLALQMGKPDQALEGFQRLSRSADEQVAALAQLYKALALRARGDTAAAWQELLELSLHPGFPYAAKVLLELGQFAYEAGRYQNARLNLEQALREATDAATLVRVLVLLGSTYQQLAQWEAALRTYRMAERLLRQGDTLLIPRWRLYWEQAALGAASSLLMLQRPGEAVQALEQLVGEQLSTALQPDEILFWLAEGYYRMGRFAQAAQVYEQVLLRYPNSRRREEALYGTAWCAFRTQQMERAAFWFERLLQEFPQSRYTVEALVRKADALYLLKQYRQAAAAYWELAQRFPQAPEAEYAAYQYGYVLYRLREYPAAEQAFRYFVQTYPRSSLAEEALYFLGWLSFQQQRYEEAIERFRNLVQANPAPALAARAWFAIGNSYYNMERWQEALEAYRTIIERYPTSPYAVEAVKSVQYCLLALGQTEEAYRWVDTIARRYPATRLEEEARLKRAELLFAHQRYEEALRQYTEFAQRYPYSERLPEVLYWAFRSALAMGDRERAWQLVQQLERQYPRQWYTVQSLLELAREEARLNPSRADSLYRHVEERGDSTQRAEALFQRGVLAYVRADTAAALALWQAALGRYPETEYAAQARYQVAMYWRARERYDSARVYLAPLARRQDALGAEALYYIGEGWMREGQCDSAVIAFQLLQTHHTGTENWYSLSLLHAGECYERLGNTAAATEMYRLVVALRPNDEYGRTARSRLQRLARERP
jgi:tol-pal system protein YbgF